MTIIEKDLPLELERETLLQLAQEQLVDIIIRSGQKSCETHYRQVIERL